MKKHAIFFDLDFTLLETHNTLSHETELAIAKLLESGHEVFISTGRQFYSAKPFHQQLNLSTPLITLNGGTVFAPDGTLLFSKPLDASLIDNLLNHPVAKEVFHVLDFEIPNKSLVSKEDVSILSFLKHQMREGFAPNIEKVTAENQQELYQAVNLYAFLAKDDFPKLAQYMEEIIPSTVGYRLSEGHGGIFFEFYPLEINKATGIAFVIDYLGLDASQTMAFGDGTNDVEMLTHVDHGVAMVNGCKEAQRVANVITTKSNKQSGVAHYLTTYFNFDK